MNRRNQITLEDIAKELNVSKVTVSKALRGHPDISVVTTELIKKTAEKMGYTPNYFARNLSSRKSNTIGLVVPKIAHFFFGSVIEAIYDTAFKNNYEIILTVSQENAEREKKHIESLLSMRVDGLIVSVSQETKDAAIFETVKQKGVPLTFIDRIIEIPDVSTVTVDDRGGSFEAVEHAIKLGYKKLGHLAGYEDIYIGKRRHQGFVDALQKHNIEVNPNWIITGGFGEEDGYKGFMKMLKNQNLPEFLFTVTYPVALGVYAAVQEVGLKIPDDIDILCFGNSDINRFISPSLSCVDQPTEELGKKAVELIIENINNFESFEPRHIEIPTNLLLRETCTAKKIVKVLK